VLQHKLYLSRLRNTQALSRIYKSIWRRYYLFVLTFALCWKPRLDGGKPSANVSAGAEVSRTARRARQIQRPTRQPYDYEGPSLSPPTPEPHLSSSPSRSTLRQPTGANTRAPPPEETAKTSGQSGYLHLLIYAPEAGTPAATS
jgi:hypothetical protein